MPSVSVILPVYNGAEFIEESILSVLRQTYFDFELIVIDNCSTDETPEILSRLAQSDVRVRVVTNSKNIGLVNSLNLGTNLASGEFLARMDADDICLPERLSRQVGFLRENPDVGLLATQYYRLFPDGRLSHRQPPATHTEICWRMLHGNTLPHPTIMLRRAAILRHQPLYRQVEAAEDYDLWVRLLKDTKGATLSTPQLVYRVHGASMSHEFNTPQKTNALAISYSQISELLPELDGCEAQLNGIRAFPANCRSGVLDVDSAEWRRKLMEEFARRQDIDERQAWALERRCLTWLFFKASRKGTFFRPCCLSFFLGEVRSDPALVVDIFVFAGSWLRNRLRRVLRLRNRFSRRRLRLSDLMRIS